LSDRKRIEDDVRKQELRYRLLFENSMDAIFLTAPDGRIFDANPSACLTFGRSRDEILAAGRDGLMDISDPNMVRLLEERERTGKTHGQLTARRPEGSLFPVEISSAIFRDTHGHEATCLILRDISRRREREVEREQLIAELQDALSKVKVLSGLLSICASCKKIRDERGRWEALEVYIRDRSAVDFSHGLCPECFKKLYPDFTPR
jgi:PAS domain S-box-containing protein